MRPHSVNLYREIFLKTSIVHDTCAFLQIKWSWIFVIDIPPDLLDLFLIFAMTFKDYKDALAGRASSKAGMKDSI